MLKVCNNCDTYIMRINVSKLYDKIINYKYTSNHDFIKKENLISKKCFNSLYKKKTLKY